MDFAPTARGPAPTAFTMLAGNTRLIGALINGSLPVTAPVLLLVRALSPTDGKNSGHRSRSSVPNFTNQPGQAGRELIQIPRWAARLDWKAVGLENLGKPRGATWERQLKRWTGQLDKSRHRPPAGLDKGRANENQAKSARITATIVHGDFPVDVLMYAPALILAVVSWEMATLGDPLAVLGYLLSNWRQKGDPPRLLTGSWTWAITEAKVSSARWRPPRRTGRAVRKPEILWGAGGLEAGDFVRR